VRLSLSTLNAVFASHPDKGKIFFEFGGAEGELSVEDVGVIPCIGGEVIMSKDSFVTDDSLTSYAGYPVTLGEARPGDWTTWKPRDVLVSTLRQIDSGELDIVSLVMVREINHGEDGLEFDTRVASPEGLAHVIGLLELGKMYQHKRSGD
jgi:hypothetical protein